MQLLHTNSQIEYCQLQLFLKFASTINQCCIYLRIRLYWQYNWHIYMNKTKQYNEFLLTLYYILPTESHYHGKSKPYKQ